MSMIYVEKQDWSLGLTATEQGISFENGHFRELTVVPSPMFHLDLEDTHGSGISLDSASGWGSVSLTYEDGRILCRLAKPAPCGDIAVNVVGYTDDRGISWYVDVINHSDTYSVAAVTYPAPVLLGKPLHLFVPDLCGRAIRDAGEKGFWGQYDYPGHNMSMPYFAWWGQEGGIYLGVHDPHACMKTFAVHAGEGQGHLKIRFPAIGAGMPANSFTPAGYVRWEAFAGDWYDATLLYREFVYTSASWLPERGRPDTPQVFKEIPYWICDYIPNSLSQMEARPMTLASVSERYGKDYWVDAAIALKERLGTPVAYHVYNWHEIPFNINYPHFLPARGVAAEGMAKLKEAGLYIFPYINAVSWEMDDGEEGFAESFAEVGIHGAAIQPDGQPLCVPYPQKKASGRDTRLAPICPSFTRWHEIMDEVARGMEAELPIDGIYFDQVAAVPSYPCRNPEHDHLPGGGSHWSDGYRRMMDKINTRTPRDKFYFSESNAEVYAKSFDGFLTWVWNTGDLVPAFPAIYAGYVQMIGRYTDGAKRDDDAYFRYHLAQSLLFGQQPGWLNAHVVYNEKRMRFLEQIVHTRYNYTKLFNEGHLLRPPHVACSIHPVTSSGITMEQVLGGVWQTDGSDHGEPPKTVLFVVNVSEERAEADIHLYPEEYGVSCPEVLHLTMEPMSVEIFEY